MKTGDDIKQIKAKRKLVSQKIETLAIARMMIATKGEDYICDALDEIFRDIPRLGHVCLILKGYISRVLGAAAEGKDITTYSEWLEIYRPKFVESLKISSEDQFRPGRLAWIDWMLEQLFEDLYRLEADQSSART